MARVIPSGPDRAVRFGLLFAAEILGLVLAFQVFASLECRLTALEGACRALRGGGLIVICFAAMLALGLWARPPARDALVRFIRRRDGGGAWAAMHGIGLVALLLPLLALPGGALNGAFVEIFPLLILGAGMAALGGMFWLAAPRDWLEWMRPRAPLLAGIAIAAALLPQVGLIIAPIWYWDRLTEVTFIAVAFLLWLTTASPVVDPAAQIIGTDGFIVAVADSCSGVEGFALVTGFVLLYAVLFRDTLRMGRFLAVIWPAALLLSWVLNVLRIAALIGIGAHVSPDLAVNGFHSFAGWLFFTLLAMGVLCVANRWRWLDREVRRTDALRLAEDPAAQRIVPFIAFMLSGVMVHTFWSAPVLGYPWQVAIMAAALWWARRGLTGRRVTIDPLAVGAGVAIGALWIWTAGPGDPTQSAALLDLGQVALAIWVLCRLVGTILLVPVIEEMFFRGYVQARLDTGTPLARLGAVAVSAALFGVLHGRWLEAGVAGVALSLLYLRRGRLGDAITAHVVANAMIACVAAWRGDWSLI